MYKGKVWKKYVFMRQPWYTKISLSESLLSSARVKAIDLLPSQAPTPEELKISGLVSRSDSNLTSNSNISELKSLEMWNEQ